MFECKLYNGKQEATGTYWVQSVDLVEGSFMLLSICLGRQMENITRSQYITPENIKQYDQTFTFVDLVM